MDITNTNFHKSTLNNSLGNSPKIDGAIIYSNIKLINIASQPAQSYTERKYKYQQMKDLIFTYLLPALIPKVSRQDWATRFFELRTAISDIPKIEGNLDYYQFLLEESMQLVFVILYSNNYYLMESLSDEEFTQMLNEGGVTIGH